MDPISALVIAVSVGAATGVVLLFAMKAPLLRMLEKSCPGDDAISFWARFTLVMLVLAPVLYSLGFGLPPSEKIPAFDFTSILVKVVTSSLVGGFFAMIGIGIWVGRIASIRR